MRTLNITSIMIGIFVQGYLTPVLGILGRLKGYLDILGCFRIFYNIHYIPS